MEPSARLTVPCDIMRKVYVPMLDDVWGVGNIDYSDVLNCSSVELGSTPHDSITHNDDYTHEYHTSRIAWLGVHGWDDNEEERIELHLTSDGSIYIFDGNHRFSAALVFHETVTFDFYGDEDKFQQILALAMTR